MDEPHDRHDPPAEDVDARATPAVVAVRDEDLKRPPAAQGAGPTEADRKPTKKFVGMPEDAARSLAAEADRRLARQAAARPAGRPPSRAEAADLEPTKEIVLSPDAEQEPALQPRLTLPALERFARGEDLQEDDEERTDPYQATPPALEGDAADGAPSEITQPDPGEPPPGGAADEVAPEALDEDDPEQPSEVSLPLPDRYGTVRGLGRLGPRPDEVTIPGPERFTTNPDIFSDTLAAAAGVALSLRPAPGVREQEDERQRSAISALEPERFPTGFTVPEPERLITGAGGEDGRGLEDTSSEILEPEEITATINQEMTRRSLREVSDDPIPPEEEGGELREAPAREARAAGPADLSGIFKLENLYGECIAALKHFGFLLPDGGSREGDAPLPTFHQVIQSFSARQLKLSRGLQRATLLVVPQTRFKTKIRALDSHKIEGQKNAHVNRVFYRDDTIEVGNPDRIRGWDAVIIDGAQKMNVYPGDDKWRRLKQRIQIWRKVNAKAGRSGCNRHDYAVLMMLSIMSQNPVDQVTYTLLDEDPILRRASIPNGIYIRGQVVFYLDSAGAIHKLGRFRATLRGRPIS